MIKDMSIFERFKELHKNNPEAFKPTPENLRRWQWHVDQMEAQRKYERVFYQKLELEELSLDRRVFHFTEFPAKTRCIYEHIASCFPFNQVCACGSRVNGDYVDFSEGDMSDIMAARGKAGKAHKENSDYDFVVDAVLPEFDLPANADQTRLPVSPSDKIAIPMWDFSKLPESEHERVIELYNVGEWLKLVEIHDQYNLSPYVYCCSLDGLKNWFTYAIREGIIGGESVAKDNG